MLSPFINLISRFFIEPLKIKFCNGLPFSSKLTFKSKLICPFERNLSNKIVYSKKKIKTLLEQRKLIAAQDNRKKKKKKDKKKQQKKTERFINKKKSTLTNFLLNSPKAREQKKETFFVNNSLSETIFNPPTEDINDYFSFME